MDQTETEKMDASLRILREIILKQIRLLEQMTQLLVLARDGQPGAPANMAAWPATCRVLPLLLQAAGTSCHSVLRLSGEPEPAVRDCLAIARATVEVLLNACYILADGEAAATQAERHAFQKSFRELDRTSKIAEHRLRASSTTVDPSDFPGLAEALAEFTGGRGQELSAWTDASVKLETIRSIYGDKVLLGLQTAVSAVYRHSSEIMQGSYFGCLYFLGTSTPDGERTIEAARWQAMNHAFNTLDAIVFAITSVAAAYAQKFDVLLVGKLAEGLFAEMQKLPIVAGAARE
jgi:hypothetical protein